MTTCICVNISSRNGLLPDVTKPLPEPLLFNHQWGTLAFTWWQFHRECGRYQGPIWIWKWIIQNYSRCLWTNVMLIWEYHINLHWHTYTCSTHYVCSYGSLLKFKSRVSLISWSIHKSLCCVNCVGNSKNTIHWHKIYTNVNCRIILLKHCTGHFGHNLEKYMLKRLPENWNINTRNKWRIP